MVFPQRQRQPDKPSHAGGPDDPAAEDGDAGRVSRSTSTPCRRWASTGPWRSVGRIPFDPLIATAFDEVFAKTGTTVDASGLKAQAFAGYIDAASGRRLAYVVYVNDVTTISQIADVIEVFADEGRISALLRAAN